MYNDPVKFSSTKNYGNVPFDENDVYTIQEFKACCDHGAFIDYDGFGFPVKDKMADPGIEIKPSKLQDIPEDATHIVWFNR
jgi:hypothetical protein